MSTFYSGFLLKIPGPELRFLFRMFFTGNICAKLISGFDAPCHGEKFIIHFLTE